MKTVMTLIVLLMTANSYADCSNLLNTANDKYTCGDSTLSYDLKLSDATGYLMVMANVAIDGKLIPDLESVSTTASLQCQGNLLVSQSETSTDWSTGLEKSVAVQSTIEATDAGLKLTRGPAGTPVITVLCKKVPDIH
jgi:hypothetical protein